MTTVLGRYVIRQVLIGTTLAVVLLVALDAVFAMIDELRDTGAGNYGVTEAMLYVALTLPRRMYEMLPPAALVGGLLWLGNLAANSELTAMRAAGMTLGRFIVWVLQAGLVVVMVMLIIGEFFAPASETRAQALKASAFDEEISVGSMGLWARDGQRMIHAESVLAGNQLVGVRIIEFTGDREPSWITRAARARFVDGDWRLEDVERSLLSHDRVVAEHRAEETIDRLIAPEYFDVLVVEPSQMAALDLSRYIDYLRENQLDAAPYEVAFWQRFTLPASTFVMLLLAIPFLFGSQREGGAGQRLFIGIAIGVSFVIVMRAITHLGLVYNLPPLLAASLPVLLFLAIALFALRRMAVRA
ncbi:LPS export ABC transporter permease LptG [Thioalkalivibrio sp. HL-Eb18]|uniref:LPS export ABC transporter permease LptG n=1 Tax=Thioalkalivibrio sp. HL-Eb18 TaxID=1266913 RepID=UPI00037281AA|nr:LPS export ABC transporter permease LptG [Thioalkalivibrio sp. HL-Eb18]